MRIAAAFALIALLAPAASFAAETLILDETAYCRAYIQFGMDRISPGLLKTVGEKVLGKRGLWGLKRSVKRRWSYLGKKWDGKAWMHDALISFDGLQYGDRTRADVYAYTSPPPAGWMKPNFDDSAWLRQRIPLGLGDHGGPIGRGSTLNRARGCFRFLFRAPGPGKAGDLVLNVAYSGGAVIYLNGTEIARGHFPRGELKADAAGEEYPLEAYVILNKDGSIARSTHRRDKGRPSYIGKLCGSFDNAPRYQDRKRKVHENLRWTSTNQRHRWLLSREQWERIRKARDRRTGRVTVPSKLLRKGVNVLAVDVRASRLHPISAQWETMAIRANEGWWHCQLIKLELSDPAGKIPSVMKRPPGVQVWVEDVHRRMISTEYGEPDASRGTVRFVGAANGSFSAQVVVSTDRELAGLKATAGRLKTNAGATLPAGALTVRYMRPHPLTDLRTLGGGRGGPAYQKNPLTATGGALSRHGPDRLKRGGLPREETIKIAQEMKYFDHITDTPPARVPARSCQPIWLSLKLPADAVPGTYRGTLAVTAQGMKPVSLPIEAEVHGWRVPDPLDFQTVVALEQSPYGVAKHYGVPLWSDRHFALMEGSLRQLGRIGNDWLFIPVVGQSEFGNYQDSMVRWARRKNGTLRFDYSHLDKYLDLAVKHLGKVRVICFVVAIGAGRNPSYVMVHDEKAGKEEKLDLSGSTLPHYAATWKTFAASLYQHMRARGLGKSMYWGYGWDGLCDRALPMTLASVTPDVDWASGGHRPCAGHYFTANSRIYDISLTAHSARGWRRRDIQLYNPRGGGSLIGISGPTLPYNYRVLPDRCIVVGLNGFGRMGADYWANIFLQGLRNEGFLRPGMALSSVLYPGENGAESSARFEALLEGVQETEARIFLEQALQRRALPPGLAKKASDVLFEHHRGTLILPSGSDYPKITETCLDWQARSRRLFGVAAEAAGAIGIDLATQQLTVDVPARIRKTVPLKLRCWTAAPRKWRAACDAKWVVLDRAAGTASGHAPLGITLDATRLEPGKAAKATLTITDAASGKALPVAITARVSKVFDFVPTDRALSRREYNFIPDEGKLTFSVAPGGRETKEVVFFNRAGVAVGWKATVPKWVTVEPAAGKALPGRGVAVRVTVRPPFKTIIAEPFDVTISEANGPAVQKIPTVCYVVPPHQTPPLPKGTAVPLDAALHKTLGGRSVAMRPRWCGHGYYYVGTRKGEVRGTKMTHYHCGTTPARTTYRIAGQGFTGFSADVGAGAIATREYWTGYSDPAPAWVRVRLDVFVDGKLRASSGWMGKTDKLRRLAVTKLENAKVLQLVTRYKKAPPYAMSSGWLNARFYKAK